MRMPPIIVELDELGLHRERWEFSLNTGTEFALILDVMSIESRKSRRHRTWEPSCFWRRLGGHEMRRPEALKEAPEIPEYVREAARDKLIEAAQLVRFRTSY